MRNDIVKCNCIYAALMGDALGVPFEFKSPVGIVDEYIEHPLSIPSTYKSYRTVPVGTISDDGSQILMVYNCIKNNLDINSELINWYNGKYWTNNVKFDCGNQTGGAIRHIQRYGTVKDMPNGSGNGSLMRILPVAFIDSYDKIEEWSKYYSYPTHNSEDSLMACEFYCKLVHLLFKNKLLIGDNNVDMFLKVWNHVEKEMNWDITPKDNEEIAGSGYVIDSLKLVYRHVMTSESFKDAVVASIKHGFDVDTNTSILAPVASLVFGLKDYPEEWDTMMRVNETNKYYTDLFGFTHE